MLTAVDRQAFRERLTNAARPPAEKFGEERLSFLQFKHNLWKNYQHTPHHKLIDDKLVQVARYIETGGKEGIGRLMIWMPPRYGKTEALRHFVAWLLGRNPDVRIINTSYGMQLAQRNSRAIRNKIASKKYQQLYPNIKLARDTKAASEWDIDAHLGGMIAAGVGGSITGHGANLIIVDDPVKSRSDAESEIKRENAKDWWKNDVITRLEEPGGAIIIIQTRWHMDDLSGWLLAGEGADDWEVLCLPALAEEDDPLGREVGEALWSEKYDKKWLNKRKEEMGEYAFSALYQQKPVPREAGLFETALIEIVDVVPDMLHQVRFYDLAVTGKKTSDYSVGAKVGVTESGDIYILHIYRVQMDFTYVELGIKQNAKLDGAHTRIRLEADKAGIIGLQKFISDPQFLAYTIDAKPPVGDKYTRATPFASRVKSNKVKMLRGAWNQQALDELSVFDKGSHDDVVDALSGAYDLLAEMIKNIGEPVNLEEELGDFFRLR